MILLHDIVEVFHLTDDDGGAVCLVVALDGGFIGVAAVNRDGCSPETDTSAVG